MRRIKFLFSVFLSLILLSACNTPNNKDDNHIILYTSIYPIQFITEELVGDEVEVISVYPPGVDAHSYEPTTREMLNIARGKAFIYLGAGMESFAESAQAALQASDVKFIEVGTHEEIFLEEADHAHDDHDHHHGDVDPHIWFDPLRMVEVCRIIKDELIEILPGQAKTIQENYAKLTDQLEDLHNEFESILQSKNNRHIIVSHAAYGYWEHRYGIIQVPISGLTAGDEPSQKDLAHIVQFAKDKKIEYVLFEQNASNRIATIIQENIGAEPLYIHNLEVLVDEDMDNEENYFTLMKANLDVLDKATK